MDNQINFEVPAKKYLEIDAQRLEQVQDGDMVIVTVDFKNKHADFVWYSAGDNPANIPAEDDDFEAVVADFPDEISSQEVETPEGMIIRVIPPGATYQEDTEGGSVTRTYDSWSTYQLDGTLREYQSLDELVQDWFLD